MEESHTSQPLSLAKADWCSTDLTISKSRSIRFCTWRKKLSVFNTLFACRIAMFPFLLLGSMVGSTGAQNGYQEEMIKEASPPKFACWTLHKPHNRVTPEWLVSEDGPAQRHLDKNEAISEARQLWLTPNRACTGSKALFALRSFVVWTKVVNKPITLCLCGFFFPVLHWSYTAKCIIFIALASVCIMRSPTNVWHVCVHRSVCICVYSQGKGGEIRSLVNTCLKDYDVLFYGI